jgi:chitodextrinase
MHFRFLALFSLLSSLPTIVAGSPAFVQVRDAEIRSGTNVSVTFRSPNAAGNLIVAYAVWDNSGSVSITDTRGNRYLSAIGPSKYSQDKANAQVFYAKNVAAGANTVTATFQRAISAYGTLYVLEYSGVDPTDPIDVTSVASGSSSSMSSGSAATTSANTLLLGAGECNMTVTRAGAGYVARTWDFGNVVEDRVVASPGSYSATATQNGSAWVMQMVAFRAASATPADTVAPSIPSGLSATVVSASQINLAWTASSDNVGVAGYKIYRCQGEGCSPATQVASSSGASYADSGLSAATNYGYAVSAFDTAGSESAKSATASAVTLSLPDTTPPVVTLTAPLAGATISGTAVTVSADASDPAATGQVTSGVAGVQFKLDGSNLGSEDTSAPFGVTLDTTAVANGSHVLTAVAWDVAGNTATSSQVTVTVSNTAADTTPPSVSITSPAAGSTVSSTIAVTAAATDDVGVAGVQFKLDGASLGAEDTVAPYSVSWDTSQSLNGGHVLTAVARDAAGNTATAAQVSVTVSNPTPSWPGLLRVDPVNPRYFTDGSGKAILLTADHTWYTLVDSGPTDPPPAFDYAAFLSLLKANSVNLFRMFAWEETRWSEGTTTPWFRSPLPFLRSGPGTALDGKPRFDLTHFNQDYFDRLRQRIIQAGDAGIYVAVQLFEGFSVADKGYPGGSSQSPWPGHPFNRSNNINSINGDSNGDGQGYETETLQDAAVTSLQEAYVRKVIDTVGDLDNVLYEIANESNGCMGSVAWQNHLINYIHTYEAGKSKQHPVGFTTPWPCGSMTDLLASNAEWISPNGDLGYETNPPETSGQKVILADTDHISYPRGDRAWMWKSVTRGLNVAFMDPYDCTAEWSPSGCTFAANANLRANLGYAQRYARRMNLRLMTPQTSLSSTGYLLASPAASVAEYLAYAPSGGSFTVDLSLSTGTFAVEWLDPEDGTVSSGGYVAGGGVRTFITPFAGDAVLYLSNAPATPDTTPPSVPADLSATATSASRVDLAWTASSDNVAVTGYRVYRDGVFLGTADVAAYADTTVSPATTYAYTVSAYDAAGNESAQSLPVMVTTPASPPPDTTAPSVSMTEPAAGATVSGVITVSASASDDVGVAGVQFKLDGNNLGSEDATAPYSASWDTTQAANGAHNVSAVARDAAGNTNTNSISVTVSNTAPASSPVALLQTAALTNDASSKTISSAFTSANTAGSLVVVAVSWDASTSATVSVSDSKGNTYTRATYGTETQNRQSLAVYYASNVKAGSNTVTATFSTASSYRRMAIHEYSGVSATSPLAAIAQNISTSGSAANDGVTSTGASLNAGVLVFGVVMDDSGHANTIAAGTGFVKRRSLNAEDLVTEDRVTAAAGVQAATFTFSVAHSYLAQMAAFKPAGSQ